MVCKQKFSLEQLTCTVGNVHVYLLCHWANAFGLRSKCRAARSCAVVVPAALTVNGRGSDVLATQTCPKLVALLYCTD